MTDAERLVEDQTFRMLTSQERRDMSVALMSMLQWFKTEPAHREGIMPETVTGKFQVVDSQGNPVFTIDPDAGFIQIVYATTGGQTLVELTNTGHLGLFNLGTGNQNLSLDAFNVAGASHFRVTAEAGVIAIQAVGTAGQPAVQAQASGDSGFGVVGIGSGGASGVGVTGNTDFGAGTGVHGHTSTGVGVLGTTDGSGLAGRFEGDVEVHNGDVRLTGSDCAEDFDVLEDGQVEPGAVMVIDEAGALQQCAEAYDKKVAGVISGAGNFKPGIILGNQHSREHRRPVALLGKVYCKVDAEYASVEIGDLLTTSPTRGHAMKAADALKAFGAVIGKALRPLRKGQGLIPILIALQ